MDSKFQWQSEHSVNIRLFDEQHKMMISLICDLHAATSMVEVQSVSEEIFAELMRHAEAHFENEERIMREHDYPGYVEHERAHDELRQEMSLLQERHREGGTTTLLQVSRYLETWLTEHILATDKKYVSFLNERGVN